MIKDLTKGCSPSRYGLHISVCSLLCISEKSSQLYKENTLLMDSSLKPTSTLLIAIIVIKKLC